MDEEAYQEAIHFWKAKEKDAVKLEPARCREKIEAFLQSRNTCALATGCGDQVRCTPLEYGYHDGAFWIFSEGGEKFRALEHQKKVSLAVYDTYDGFGSLNSVQIQGTAAVIEPDAPAYERAAAWKKIPMAALQKLDHPMYLLQIIPQHADFLCSALKKQGYSVRQVCDFTDNPLC